MLRRAFLLSVALASMPAMARAADVPPDVQRSMAAYERARKLIDSGDCTTAIPLLQESIRYNDSIGAHLSIAECRPDDPLAAYREFKLAGALAQRKGDGRARYAQEQMTALQPRIALLRIVLPAHRTVALLDGKTIEEPNHNAVEPGSHTVEFVSAEGTRSSKTITAVVGQTVRVAEDPPAPALAPSPPPQHEASQTLPIIVGGAGVGLGVAGAIFGLLASSKLSDAKELCPNYPSCPAGKVQDARNANDTARTEALVSTIGIGAGALALGAGIVLYFARPHRSTTALGTPMRFEF
jgi:hypothetical protein